MLSIFAIVEQVQNTRVWLFVKGIFLLFLAALVALNIFSVYILMVLLAVMAIVSGLVTIIVGLTNRMEHKHYPIFAFITGIIKIILGVFFFLWPAFSTQFWVIFYLLGLMLDGLLIAGAMLSVKAMGASKWWAIIGGLIVLFLGLFFVFRVALIDPLALAQIGALVATFAVPSDMVLAVWRQIGNDLAMYLFISSIFFFVTVMVINPKNIAQSMVKKATKGVRKSVRGIEKEVQRSVRGVEKNVRKEVRKVEKNVQEVGKTVRKVGGKVRKAGKSAQKSTKKAVKNVKRTVRKLK